jgi:chromosome condensin MukBEF complex kleisin-like MukF subunit
MSAERDARLDKLKKAVEEWADKRTQQYQARVASNKALLKGRTGAERLAQNTVRAASDQVVRAIDEFLLS